MILNISGRNMDTGAAFQEHARATLHSIVEKYFSNAVSGTVTLEKSDAGFEVNIRINLTKRIELESSAICVMPMRLLILQQNMPKSVCAVISVA